MLVKVLLLTALLVGSLALPAPEADMSRFFVHSDPAARIVGGSQAPDGSAPWMTAMTTGTLIRSFLCGGSLVGTRTILTAAHCIEAAYSWGSLVSSLRVTVGTNRWNTGGATYAIARNATHANYLSDIIKNDIGVLITTINVALSPLVQPVSIAPDFIQGGVAARVTGWGRIRQGGALSASLLELSLGVIDGQRCIDEVKRADAELNMRAPPVEPHIEICTFHSPGRFWQRAGACERPAPDRRGVLGLPLRTRRSGHVRARVSLPVLAGCGACLDGSIEEMRNKVFVLSSFAFFFLPF